MNWNEDRRTSSFSVVVNYPWWCFGYKIPRFTTRLLNFTVDLTLHCILVPILGSGTSNLDCFISKVWISKNQILWCLIWTSRREVTWILSHDSVEPVIVAPGHRWNNCYQIGLFNFFLMLFELIITTTVVVLQHVSICLGLDVIWSIIAPLGIPHIGNRSIN